MPRKQETVTIDQDGRDLGKSFLITEMDAWAAILWAARALLAATRSGVPIPEKVDGPQTLAALGLRVLFMLPPDAALPLMHEAKACVKFLPPAGNGAIAAQDVDMAGASAVEEPATWLILLRRAYDLHVGFSSAGEPPITG
jgi:hypothetical protein